MTPGFDIFISDIFGLYDSLAREFSGDRRKVVRSGKRALAVLPAYGPGDDGEEILIETAIEQFEDLVRRAGGDPT